MDPCQSKGRSSLSLDVECIAIEMVGETGIEPVTPDLEGPCSIQLSYSPDMLALGPPYDPRWRTRKG